MSTQIPENLMYTKEHEWALINDGVMTIGITDFAQSALGDIVFVEFPAVGEKIQHGKTFGVVESIKSVSDLYAPGTGEVIARNQEVEQSPEKLNQNAYESWLIKVKLSNHDTSHLLTPAQYKEFCQSSH